MKRLILFAIIVAAAWYGWKHHDELRSRGTHELVLVNHSGLAIARIRVGIADDAWAVETLADGATATVPVRCEKDGTFDVSWQVPSKGGDRHWVGGVFTHGPLLMRHRFEFVDGDGVIWSSERKPGKGSAAD